MEIPDDANNPLQRIATSAGSAYLDRVHQRSFSLNVFQMNAVALVEATQRVKDPDQGMALMLEKNREAGRQAHRELSRHVHNFVSSALTLVEHTRVFMRKHYEGTELLETYENQVAATFTPSPVAQFVQGLRNYMLHRGLPNSSMFMTFTRGPGVTDESGVMETGVRYDTPELLDWDRWKPSARAYLQQAGEHLDIHEFVEQYLTLINQFHGWLDATLAAHHQSDLQELRQLQAKHEAMRPEAKAVSTTSVDATGPVIVEPFGFSALKTAELEQISTGLLGKIRELHFPPSSSGFPTQRPTTTVSDSDLVGPLTFWSHEAGGEKAFMFIAQEGKSYGLTEGEYGSLEGLADTVLDTAWARDKLSRKFVEMTFCDWARERFDSSSEGPSFPHALGEAARMRVGAVEVWASIAHLEVEEGFDFGPVRIEPVTADTMAVLRSKAPSARPDQEPQVSQLFDQLRNKIQGYAAVVVSLEAEPDIAQERSLRIAQDAVGLLNFFSPSATRGRVFNPVALQGAQHIPTSHIIVLHDGGFRLDESMLPRDVGFWRLSAQQISELKRGPLDAAASLVVREGLNEFALTVRASLLDYSKGTAFAEPLDRLRSSLSAIEGILLRHEMEPRSHSVASRMGFLLAQRKADRLSIQQLVQKIYWLQEQSNRTAQGRREAELIEAFTWHAHRVLVAALGYLPVFDSKVQFVIEVDRLGIDPH